MKISIDQIDSAPEELYEQVPLEATLLREIVGPDRPDYWLAVLSKPLRWLKNDEEFLVTHLVLCARFVGARIDPGVGQVVVGIAYVTDSSILEDEHLDFAKCFYSAIGVAHEITKA